MTGQWLRAAWRKSALWEDRAVRVGKRLNAEGGGIVCLRVQSPPKNALLLITVITIGVFAGGWFYANIPKLYPLWAWEHGTTEMQVSAAHKLVKDIHPGDDFREVALKLRPGSAGGDLPYDGRNYVKYTVVTFDVRADVSVGIEVWVRDNRVVSACIHD